MDGRSPVAGFFGRFFPCSSSSHVSLLYDIPRAGLCLASIVTGALIVCARVCVHAHMFAPAPAMAVRARFPA